MSFGANGNQEDTFTGEAFVPVYYSYSSTVTSAESGNQIIATAVPEPATWGWIGSGGLLLLSLFRRRFGK
jgi:hypothetical protein